MNTGSSRASEGPASFHQRAPIRATGVGSPILAVAVAVTSAINQMRHCIFCGGTVDTVEHVWPRWALELIIHPGIRGEVSYSRSGQSSRTFPVTGDSVDLQIRHLCAGCNNGWLSDLEGSVRLVISAIILDLPVVLGHIQTQVSAWCFKTALIAQKGGGAGFYTDADAQAFRATRLPPATHTAIWLARHTGELSVFFEAVTLYPAERAQPAVPIGYVTTAVISHLAMQVLTVRPDAGIAAVPVAPGPWDQALLPV